MDAHITWYRPGTNLELRRSWVFLDFEASALAVDSFPIEAGWTILGADLSMATRSYLIRPTADWRARSWSPDSERIHGVTQDVLTRFGCAPAMVAMTLLRDVARHDATLACGNPWWDGKWLNDLLTAAGHEDVSKTLRVNETLGFVQDERISAQAYIASQNLMPDDPPHRAGTDAAMFATMARTAFLHESGLPAMV